MSLNSISVSSTSELAQGLGTPAALEESLETKASAPVDEKELEALLDRYTSLYDFAPVGYATLDRNGVIVRINLTGAWILGYERRRLVGLPLLGRVVKSDRRKLLAHLGRLRRHPRSDSVELRFERADQSEVLLQLVSLSTPSDPKGLGSIRMVLSDVTAHRRSEFELNEARAELAAISETLIDAIVTIDVDHRILHFNAAAERMFGCPAGEAISRSLWQFIPERSRDALERQVALLARDGRKPRLPVGIRQLRAVRANGVEFPVEVSLSRLQRNGSLLVTAVIRDLSEVQRAEEQLRKTLESIRDGFIACDADWRCVYANAAAQHMAGFPRERFLGKSFWELFPRARGIPLEAEYRRAASGVATEFESFYEPWGRWFHHRCFPREGGGLSIYFEDITERKQAESTLRATRDELAKANVRLETRVAQRTAELEAANASLRQEIESRRELQRQLLEISEREQLRIGQDLHDGLGQQMTGMMLLAEVLHEQLARASLTGHEEAKRLVGLLSQARGQLRQLARGLHPVAPTADGLILALEDLAENVSSLPRVKLSFRHAGQAEVRDNVVATHLFRIAQEAVHNALRHGRSERIRVTLAARNGSVRLAIQDNGSAKRRFGREKPAGLGLEIMRARCEAIGARLNIRPVRPHGTLVECVLHPPSAVSESADT